MARRRMISLDILDGVAFSDMSIEARYLYLEFTARADDEGILANARKIARMVDASFTGGYEDELINEMESCGLIYLYRGGEIVIRDWYLANRVQKDRFNSSIHISVTSTLELRGTRYFYKDPKTGEVKDD